MKGEKALKIGSPDEQRAVAEASNAALEATHFIGDSENPIVAAFRLNTMAHDLQRQGRYDEAERLYRRAIALREEHDGSDHPHTATSFYDLTEMFKEQGRYGEAEPLLRRLLAIREKTHGVGHPETLSDFNNLIWVLRFHASALLQQATALSDQGRYHDAEPLLRRALILAEENPNAKPLYLSALLNRLAEALHARGCAAAAEPFYRRALMIEERVLGGEDPRIVVSIHHLAEALKDQGRLVEAELLLRRALAIDEQAGSLDHPDTATDLYRLVEVLRAQGRTAEADPLFRRALNIQRKLLQSGHPAACRNLQADPPPVQERCNEPRQPDQPLPVISHQVSDCAQKQVRDTVKPALLLPGNWRPVPDFGQKRVLDKLKLQASDADQHLFSRISGLRALELPFYRYSALYEGNIENGRIAFIRCRQHFTVLNGAAEPIQALNAAAPLLLETAAQAMAYLRFHCAAIQREFGTFYIVENPGDLHGLANAVQYGVVEEALRPLTIHPTLDNAWRAEGVVLYGNALHAISWVVARTGQVDRASDQPCAQLPVQSPRFIGSVRYVSGF